jgi:hypothetical protein
MQSFTRFDLNEFCWNKYLPTRSIVDAKAEQTGPRSPSIPQFLLFSSYFVDRPLPRCQEMPTHCTSHSHCTNLSPFPKVTEPSRIGLKLVKLSGIFYCNT